MGDESRHDASLYHECVLGQNWRKEHLKVQDWETEIAHTLHTWGVWGKSLVPSQASHLSLQRTVVKASSGV